MTAVKVRGGLLQQNSSSLSDIPDILEGKMPMLICKIKIHKDLFKYNQFLKIQGGS